MPVPLNLNQCGDNVWQYNIDDDGEAFENNSYYDMKEHIKHSQIQCHWKVIKQTFTQKLKNWL